MVATNRERSLQVGKTSQLQIPVAAIREDPIAKPVLHEFSTMLIV